LGDIYETLTRTIQYNAINCAQNGPYKHGWW